MVLFSLMLSAIHAKDPEEEMEPGSLTISVASYKATSAINTRMLTVNVAVTHSSFSSITWIVVRNSQPMTFEVKGQV